MINLENMLKVLNSSFLETFDFEHKNTGDNLIIQINNQLKNNLEKIEDFYKNSYGTYKK